MSIENTQQMGLKPKKTSKREKFNKFKAKTKEKIQSIAILFLVVVIGLTLIISAGFHFGIIGLGSEKHIIIVNPAEAKEVSEPEEVVKEETRDEQIERISQEIWKLESTNGKNNYSKCEEAGKINGIGYGIPGNGTYQCFDSHEDEMQVLKGWIIDKFAKGMTEKELMCLYSGNHYKFCN